MLWDIYFLFYDKIKFGIFKLGEVKVFSLFGIRVSVILFEYFIYIYIYIWVDICVKMYVILFKIYVKIYQPNTPFVFYF